MKAIFKIAGIGAIILVMAAFQSPKVKGVLSKENLRKEVMDSIARNPSMATEMMNTMMDNRQGMSVMMGNQNLMYAMMGNTAMMQQMIKNHPNMIGSMMGAMLNASKGDSSAYMNMYNHIKNYPEMMSLMYSRMSGHGHHMNESQGMMGHGGNGMHGSMMGNTD